jgi:hypothetical protein
MEGIKFEDFLSGIKMVESSAYKAIGALGQRIAQVIDPKGSVSSIFSKISTYVKSFFAAPVSKADPGMEMVELGQCDLRTEEDGLKEGDLKKSFRRVPLYDREFRVSTADKGSSQNGMKYGLIQGAKADASERLLMIKSSVIL